MTELLTAAQMRAIEQAAIESGQVTGLELMERAGQGVVEAIFEEWPELAENAWGPAPTPPEYLNQDEIGRVRRAVVLCGPGNNGGDGFVVARLLRERGWEVEVFLYGDADKLPPDARMNYDRWCELGEARALSDDEIEDYAEANPGTELAIDALFGTGLTRPFHKFGIVQDELNYWACSSGTGATPRVICIDVPSGLCADSGHFLGFDPRKENPFDFCIFANLTVTFHTEKIGHRVLFGPDACQKVRVVDIGLVTEENAAVNCALVAKPTKRLGKSTMLNKFSHGHALVLSGGPSQTGAARLAARGALRVGAGLVTIGAPSEAQQEVASQVTAIMLKRAGTPDEVVAMLKDDWLNAVCVGPGLGLDRARAMVRAVLEAPDHVRGYGRFVVLDADALSCFADAPEELFALLNKNCILTPHGGEFARLFPDLSERLHEKPSSGPAYSKVDATREAAKRAGCVVLFKGPDTVIAHPDGRCSVHSAQYDRAAPWLATAGSGDVLAGFITGLLARGFDPMQAAESAAWLHVECALKFGPGLIAEDLPEMLPKVFADLGI